MSAGEGGGGNPRPIIKCKYVFLRGGGKCLKMSVKPIGGGG